MRRGKYENGNVEVRDRCAICEYMKCEKVKIGNMRFREITNMRIWDNENYASWRNYENRRNVKECKRQECKKRKRSMGM